MQAISMKKKKKSFSKYFFDITLSLLGIIIFFIPMIVISLLIWIKMGRPLFFVQERPGKEEKCFKLYKFRTMLDIKDKNGNHLNDAQRLTPFGRFLRSTSLDEFPELLNVLKGEMSLVGPRPLLVEYLPFYTEQQRQRHLVKPGITGWAQVKGRNALTWEEKFDLDIWYVNNNSIYMDIKIIFMTIISVLKREGISHKNCSTMPRFDEEKRNAQRE